mmetsp:Transcript_8426/g.17125  ORF Transcript_8426/g.17125 Transcript_8426/m.17125 type:complete len:517 (-) Transcript_8426:268-1818(-)
MDSQLAPLTLSVAEGYQARHGDEGSVYVPGVARSQMSPGIVHIGVGGFHRSHQALYTMEVLGHDPSWAIVGVGLLLADEATRDVLARQDFCYSLIEKGHFDCPRAYLITSILDFVVAPVDGIETVLETLSKENIRIVSLTVTEKGYCFDAHAGDLDWTQPVVQHDVDNPHAPESAIGVLVAALYRRWRSGHRPFTIVSCDNVPLNGKMVSVAVRSMAEKMVPQDESFHRWIETECRFPSTMVDGITPVTCPADVDLASRILGYLDSAPSVREPYRQWVIENAFVDDRRPPWHRAGAQMVDNVEPFELCKIRLLNVPHSAVAYLGSVIGLTFIHEASSQSVLERYLRGLMGEICPTLETSFAEASIDSLHYRNVLVFRFQNSEIRDTIARVSQDGSAKYSKQLVPIVLELLEQRRSVRHLALAVSSWAFHLRGRTEAGNDIPVFDPRAEELQAWMRQGQDGGIQGLQSLLRDRDIFGTLVGSCGDSFRAHVEKQYQDMISVGVLRAVEVVLGQSELG